MKSHISEHRRWKRLLLHHILLRHACTVCRTLLDLNIKLDLEEKLFSSIFNGQYPSELEGLTLFWNERYFDYFSLSILGEDKGKGNRYQHFHAKERLPAGGGEPICSASVHILLHPTCLPPAALPPVQSNRTTHLDGHAWLHRPLSSKTWQLDLICGNHVKASFTCRLTAIGPVACLCPGYSISQQPVHQWIYHITQLQASDVAPICPTLLAQKQVCISRSNIKTAAVIFHSLTLFHCRNHSKPHLRPTLPTVERGTGLLDNPSLFPSFSSERLNGVRSSPPTRLPATQPRTRLPSAVAFPRRDTVGTGRVAEATATDYSLGVGRGRYVNWFSSGDGGAVHHLTLVDNCLDQWSSIEQMMLSRQVFRGL